jgi:hypothetical protein
LVLKGRTGEGTRQKAKDETKNSIDWKRPRKYNWQSKGLIFFLFLVLLFRCFVLCHRFTKGLNFFLFLVLLFRRFVLRYKYTFYFYKSWVLTLRGFKII